MKLTDKQLALLKAMKGGSRVSFHPYMGRFNPHEHYYAVGVGSCTPTAKALLKRGLAKKADQDSYGSGHILVLTDAGKKAAG